MAATMGSRDHRRHRRPAGRGAARPVRDAAVHRLQHERLLPALARPRREARGRSGAKLPKIYCVNWFRKGADGKFVWPGYGENMRVLQVDRSTASKARPTARENAFGISPRYEDLNWSGLDFSRRASRSSAASTPKPGPASSRSTTSCSASSPITCRPSCPRCAGASPRASPVDDRRPASAMSQPESAPPSRGAVAAADQDLSDAEFAELDALLAAIPEPLEPLDAVMLDGFLCGVIVQPMLHRRPTPGCRMCSTPAAIAGARPSLEPEQRRARALILRRHAALNRAIAEVGGFDPLILEPDDEVDAPKPEAARRGDPTTSRCRRRSPRAACCRGWPASSRRCSLLPGLFELDDPSRGGDARAAFRLPSGRRRARSANRRTARHASARWPRSTTRSASSSPASPSWTS